MVKRAIIPLGAALLLLSCVSHPKVGKPEVRREDGVAVIDDQYHLTRGTPGWILLEPAAIEETSEYPDRYAFKGVSTNGDLTGLQLWLKGFVASPGVARFVGARVRDRLAEVAAGDVGTLEAWLDGVVAGVSGVPYTGARIEERYWRLITRARDDGGTEDVYECHVLYTVGREQIDAAIARALQDNDRKAPATTEDERTARCRVRDVMESEGLGD